MIRANISLKVPSHSKRSIWAGFFGFQTVVCSSVSSVSRACRIVTTSKARVAIDLFLHIESLVMFGLSVNNTSAVPFTPDRAIKEGPTITSIAQIAEILQHILEEGRTAEPHLLLVSRWRISGISLKTSPPHWSMLFLYRCRLS